MPRVIDKNIRQGIRGFSLPEILLSVFIIAILSVSAVIGFRSGQKSENLNQAARQVISGLRRAQNLSQSGKNLQTSQYYGYGVVIVQNQNFYRIYANRGNNDSVFDVGDQVIETINLPSGVSFLTGGDVLIAQSHHLS